MMVLVCALLGVALSAAALGVLLWRELQASKFFRRVSRFVCQQNYRHSERKHAEPGNLNSSAAAVYPAALADPRRI